MFKMLNRGRRLIFICTYYVYCVIMSSYYKYRSLSDWKRFVDIIVSNRLYAAYYKCLNDPMEGRYSYNGKGKHIKPEVYSQMKALRVLSLTCDSRNWLMWSHYANGHTGCCIELGMTKYSRLSPKPIKYVDKLPIRRYINTGEDLLCYKSKIWEYENEVRVLTKSPFVKIVIKSITFGYRVSDKDFSLLKKMICKITPELENKIIRIKKEDLLDGF